MLALNCLYCGSKHIRMLTNEDGYAEFSCDICGKRWGMTFEMVELEDGEKDTNNVIE